MTDTRSILNERGKTHGDYTDHARVTQTLKAIIESEQGFRPLPAIMREALDMIAHKIGRILVGNPRHADHWLDISGYATLVADRLKDEEPFIPGTPEDGAQHSRHPHED